MKATKLAIEERYSDNSGVEFAVRYDASDLDSAIRIVGRGSGEAQFPADHIEWLIDALYRVKNELPVKPTP